MSQFAVHRNCNQDSAGRYPFLLDVQSPLLEGLETRLVIPLTPLRILGGRAMDRVTPVFEIHGEAHVLLTPQMAGVARKELGNIVTDFGPKRDSIIAAIDFLITGC
ncbi:CcdB family protein [Rhodocyclaceae bacterium SMB388]